MPAQVCAMRLPTEVLEQHLRPILEGLLLWSEDSKNKFKLKVLHSDMTRHSLICSCVAADTLFYDVQSAVSPASYLTSHCCCLHAL